MTLEGLIRQHNAPMLTPASQIHRLEDDEIPPLAALIRGAAAAYGIELAYFCGAINQESRFDPRAYHHNLDLQHPFPTFERTDWGIAMFSGAQLPGYPGMIDLDQDAMAARALDPAWAVPTMALVYRDLLAWARSAHGAALADNARAVLDPIEARGLAPSDAVLWLATFGYNSGRHGALLDLAKPQPERIRHPDAVMGWTREFRTALQGGDAT